MPLSIKYSVLLDKNAESSLLRQQKQPHIITLRLLYFDVKSNACRFFCPSGSASHRPNHLGKTYSRLRRRFSVTCSGMCAVAHGPLYYLFFVPQREIWCCSHARQLEISRDLQHILNPVRSHKGLMVLNQHPRCAIAMSSDTNRKPPERWCYF
eukprot:IDg1156t1